jgi:hypothetical protein
MTKTLTVSGFIAFAILLAYPSVSMAQAWTKSENSGFYKLDFTRVASSRVFDTHGEVLPFRPTSNNTFSVYGEYGITNKLGMFLF